MSMDSAFHWTLRPSQRTSPRVTSDIDEERPGRPPARRRLSRLQPQTRHCDMLGSGKVNLTLLKTALDIPPSTADSLLI